MYGFSKALDLLTGNNSRVRAQRHSSRSPRRRRGPLGMQHLRLEPLEERTLLSFTAVIEQAAGVAPFAPPAQVDPANTATIKYEVTFGDFVTDFPINAISTAGTTLPSAAALTVNAPVRVGGDATLGSKNWTVSITVGAGNFDGIVQASVIAASVRNAILSDSNAVSTSSDNQVRYDNTRPTVTIEQATSQVDPASTLPIHYTATFSEKVTGFEKADVTVTAGTVTSVTPVGTDGRVYDVVVGDLTADAIIRATIGAGVASDDAGNTNLASTSTDNEVGFNIPLTVAVDQMPLPPGGTQADPTNVLPVFFQAQFSEPINPATFTEADITVGGTAPGLTVVPGSITLIGTNLYRFAMSATGDGTLTASIAAAKVQDASGENNAASTSTDNSVTYDHARPTVTINKASAQADPTTTTPIHYTVVFNEKVTGFDETDITGVPAGATCLVTPQGTAGTTYDVAIDGVTTDTTVTLTIGAERARDVAGNLNMASTSTDNSVFYNIPLAVTVNQVASPPLGTQADPTNTLPVLFVAQFNEPINPATFTEADITVGGTASGVAVVAGSLTALGGNAYSFALTATGEGTLIASIGASKLQDASGENNAASTSTDNTVIYDKTSPDVTINKAVMQVDPTNGNNPIQVVAAFSEDIDASSVSGADLTVTQRSGGTLTWAVPTATQIDARTWLFTVSGFGADQHGTLDFTMAAGAVCDIAGDGTPGTGNLNKVSTSTDNDVTVDTHTLTATVALAAGQMPITNASPINFTLTFSSPVTDFDEADALAGLGGTAFNWAATESVVVTGGGATYNVAVSGMSNAGSVTFQLPWGSAHDEFGNQSTWSNLAMVTYDRPLTVDVEQAQWQADPTNASPINFVAKFTDEVVDFAATKVQFTGSTAPGTLSATVSNSGYNSTTNTWDYDVAVKGMTSSGKVVVSILPGTVHDAGWHASAVLASTDAEVTYTDQPTVTVDQAATQADPAGASPVNFTVVFSQPVNGFTAGDVVVTTGWNTAFYIPDPSYGTTNTPINAAPVVAVTDSGDHKTFNVAVSGMIVDGSVTVSIPANVAQGSASGENNLAANWTDNTVDFLLPLTVTINQAGTQADPAGAGAIHFTAVFAEPVDNFSKEDVSLTGSTAPGAAVTSVTKTDVYGMVYDVVVSGMTGSGTVVASVPAGVAGHNGNANLASTSTDNSVAYDVTAPTATVNQKTGQADPTTALPMLFTVVFSEKVTDFDDLTDVTVSAGTVSKITPVGTNGTTYEVEVGGLTAHTVVTATVAAGVATDAAGNTNVAAMFTDNSVTYDNPAPTVTINQAAGQDDPATAATINFTVVFSQSVTGFTAADVNLTGSTAFTQGTRTVTPSVVVTGSGTTYNVAVSGMIADGTVVAAIPANAAQNATAVKSLAAASTDNSVTYDLPLTVTVNQTAGQSDPATAGPIHFTAVFSEPVTTLTAAGISLAGSTAAGATVQPLFVPADGMTWDIVVSGMTSKGTVVVSIPAGAATSDGGTQANAASTSTDNSVTYNFEAFGWDTIGLYSPTRSIFFLRNTNDGGYADLAFDYGAANAGWIPVTGDWDGDGADTIGLYHTPTSTFYLKNSNSGGAADVMFGYGAAGNGLLPIAGDWNGDGTDTVGLYHPATGAFYLKNANTGGYADTYFKETVAVASVSKPIAGDWNGDGTDTIGLYNPNTSTFSLQSSNDGAVTTADTTFAYAPAAGATTPLIGDWDGDGTDTIALYNPATSQFYLRNANSAGAADQSFWYGAGNAGLAPIAGDWNGSAKQPLMAGGQATGNAAPLSEAALLPIVEASLAGWNVAGLSAASIEALKNVRVQVADLPGSCLGVAQEGTIVIDRDAAGHGWYVDATPGDDAIDPRAVDKMDLLTVVEHEMGHVLGLSDLDASVDSLMSGTLEAGVRRTAEASDVDAVFAQGWL